MNSESRPLTASDLLAKLSREIEQAEQRNTELARMLCSVGKALLHGAALPRDVVAWWTEHRKWDEANGELW